MAEDLFMRICQDARGCAMFRSRRMYPTGVQSRFEHRRTKRRTLGVQLCAPGVLLFAPLTRSKPPARKACFYTISTK